MTACQRVLLKLGTTHPTSQINWFWYQSAVCVLIFLEKTTSPNWTGEDLDQSETSSHDSRVMARLPFFFFPLLWTNEKRLLLWLCRTGSPVYHMRSLIERLRELYPSRWQAVMSLLCWQACCSFHHHTIISACQWCLEQLEVYPEGGSRQVDENWHFRPKGALQSPDSLLLFLEELDSDMGAVCN